MAKHEYKHLDDEPNAQRLEISLTTREVAEKIADLNYGVHRFLSHLIDVRRERLVERSRRYFQRGDDDLGRAVLADGDELANELEKLLARGLH